MKIKLIRFNKIPILILIISIIYFVYTASYEIKYPGLYYDETLFLNAALGGLDNSFIHKKIFGIPVMLMPYIGAVKAYIFYPIFYFFGVSPETIRIPSIIISTLTLILSFFLSKEIFNKWVASLIVIVLATDPSFIYTSRLDWGPVVLMIFFKILTLLSFFKIIANSEKAQNDKIIYWYILLLSALILGLWDKLNFIWFISSFLICTIIFYRKNINNIWNIYKSKLAIPSITFITIIFFMLVELIIPILNLGDKNSESLFDRFERIHNTYEQTVSGQAVYEFIFNQSIPYTTWVSQLTFVNIILFLITLLIAIFLGINQQDRQFLVLNFNSEKILLFLSILFGLIYMQIVSTRQAGGPHHIMILFPLQHFFNIATVVVLLELIVKIFGIFTQKSNKFIREIGITLIIIVFGYLINTQIQVNNNYSLALQNKISFNNSWSPKIYELSDYLNKYQGQFDSIISADWGFHTQLYGLAQSESRSKYIDLWTTFNDLHKLSIEEKEKFYERFFKGKNTLVLLHSKNATMMEYSQSNFLSFSSEFFKESKLIKSFYKINDEVIYEVYTVIG